MAHFAVISAYTVLCLFSGRKYKIQKNKENKIKRKRNETMIKVGFQGKFQAHNVFKFNLPGFPTKDETSETTV